MRALVNAILLASSSVSLSAAIDAPASWEALSFLSGTWDARTQGGAAGAQASGSYSFTFELKQHVLVRRTQSAGDCKGPADFDCGHHDLLYVYEEPDATGR